MAWVQAICTYVTVVQLGLHVGPLVAGTVAVSASVACLWVCFPLTGLPCVASIQENVPSLTTT